MDRLREEAVDALLVAVRAVLEGLPEGVPPRLYVGPDGEAPSEAGASWEVAARVATEPPLTVWKA